MSTNPLENPNIGRWLAPGAIILLTAGIVAVINMHRHSIPVQAAIVPESQLSPDEFQARIASPNAQSSLIFKDGKVISGSTDITVNLGDSVNVKISTQSDEIKVSLPGYDITTEASDTDGADGGFNFVADKAGTFPFYIVSETDDSDAAPSQTQVGTITVK